MNAIRYNRFTDPGLLKQLGRPLLERFLLSFQPGLSRCNLLLPPAEALDQEYFHIFAHLLMSPEGLPEEMGEALHAISEMASPEGQERLEQTLARSGVPLEHAAEATPADVAMQVWLAQPEVLARARNLHRLARLSTFHHFGPGKGAAAVLGKDPGETAALIELQGRCDAWFALHNRGRQNTRVEVYVVAEDEHSGSLEYWFLIRHGDIFARAPKVERGRMEVLHFRPARDDVVVYSVRRNELRINARTVGERDLYRAAFGQHLFGDPNFFSERRTYTLAPLRRDGVDALDTRDVPALKRIILREFEVALPGPYGRRTCEKASNLFAAAEHHCFRPAIPPVGELTRATFELHFAGTKPPRCVQLRPPNTLRLSRHSDVQATEQWLRLRGFRISAGSPVGVARTVPAGARIASEDQERI